MKFKITTKIGDAGYTRLIFNKTIHKSSPRINAIGKLDTLNSYLGLLHEGSPEHILEDLVFCQKKLVYLMGELSCLDCDISSYREKFSSLSSKDIEELNKISEYYVESLNEQGYAMQDWVVYGSEGSLSARFDYASKLCREAEVAINEPALSIKTRNKNIIVFVNRLSDILFLMARILRERK